MAIADRLQQVASLEDQKEKTEQYKRLLAELVAAASEADIKDYVEHSECLGGTKLLGLALGAYSIACGRCPPCSSNNCSIQ